MSTLPPLPSLTFISPYLHQGMLCITRFQYARQGWVRLCLFWPSCFDLRCSVDFSCLDQSLLTSGHALYYSISIGKVVFVCVCSGKAISISDVLSILVVWTNKGGSGFESNLLIFTICFSSHNCARRHHKL